MKRILLVLALVGMFAAPCVAQKEREFPDSPNKIFDAALEVAKRNYTMDAISREEGTFTFQTGISLTNWGFRVTATFDGLPGGCGKAGAAPCVSTIVRLRTAKRGQLYAWSAGGRIAKKFFGQLDAELKARAEKKSVEAQPRVRMSGARGGK